MLRAPYKVILEGIPGEYEILHEQEFPHLDERRFTYMYNAEEQMTLLVDPQNDRTTFAYDAAGRRTVKRSANGTRASFTYNNAGQVTLLSNLKSDQSVISSFNYKYDATDNRTSVTEANGDRVTWTYDNDYQLTAEHRSGANAYSTTSTYDGVGDQLVQNADAARTTYTYDAANQLVTAVAAAGTTTYAYDADGNQRLVHASTGDRSTYIWDFENHNTRIDQPSSQIMTMAYEPEGKRVKKETPTRTTKFIWDERNYLLETDGANVTTAAYTSEVR